jgi:hypothetical protein
LLCFASQRNKQGCTTKLHQKVKFVSSVCRSVPLQAVEETLTDMSEPIAAYGEHFSIG